jgi:hypothetical protein
MYKTQKHALSVAYCCAGTVRLPNEYGFPWRVKAAAFDFTNAQRNLTVEQQQDCKAAASVYHTAVQWFGMHDAPKWLRKCAGACPQIDCEKAYLGGLLADAECDKLDMQPDEIVMQLRSGDIWTDAPNPHYGQPPLAYYTAVLQHGSWTNVTIITEPNAPQRMHPLVPTLAAALPDVVRIHSSKSFRDDLQVALCARTLVLSRSTLEAMILWHSSKLEVVYAEALADGWSQQGGFPRSCNQFTQLATAKPHLSLYVMPPGPDYTPYMNWQNTHSQRLEMLTYHWPPSTDGTNSTTLLQRCPAPSS